ncbi:acetyltransferase [Pontibacter akesuensis]|uniref:Sugar O-acyltransferase, sialic acid O-acetyltransferase NeuD family n=1 Tax=Pontibacter akesuensis TaxID=388950 RepID=A0A1I7H4Z1_9BACT|nr:acetyltransferase [Pontibacter akesuensis]GHA53411.1 acetyltransferase [Pontibacter akesuensis]SFU55767.1 sugar O-acyltransferase, sialic acid O-acetyltransferase NeuD family [Pontibacter akesuensis]
MYLYGASGHAKVIIDILQGTGVAVEGLFDDNPDLKMLGGIQVLGKLTAEKQLHAPLLISIGNNSIRKRIARSLKVEFKQAIDKTAILSPSARIGAGTVVMQGAILQADVEVGKHAIINTGAKVDHDCVVGDFAHISPGAILCGNVSVGEGTWVGAGAVVIPGVKIGKWCRIGAGAVVIRDLPDNVVAVGNPSKIIKHC